MLCNSVKTFHLDDCKAVCSEQLRNQDAPTDMKLLSLEIAQGSDCILFNTLQEQQVQQTHSVWT